MRSDVMPDLAKSLGEGRVGYLQRDKQSGKFADEWNKAYVRDADQTVEIQLMRQTG